MERPGLQLSFRVSHWSPDGKADVLTGPGTAPREPPLPVCPEQGSRPVRRRMRRTDRTRPEGTKHALDPLPAGLFVADGPPRHVGVHRGRGTVYRVTAGVADPGHPVG